MSDDTLAAAIAQVQSDLPAIVKGETAKVEMKGGGSYSYKYADLADISALVLPRLAQHGLAFVCRPTVNEAGAFVLAYSLLHRSGESLNGEYPLKVQGTPQAIGSEITYARRYCLCAVTGVAPEDDDGQAAERASQAPTSTEPEAQQTSRTGARECVLCNEPIVGGAERADDGWAHKGECP